MLVFLDSLRRKFAHQIARLLAKTPVTPNQVTIARSLLAIASSVYFFTRGTHLANLIGLTIYVSLTVFDWVDGELARLTDKSSAVGKWLDDTLDRLLMITVLASIFYGGISSGDVWAWGALAVFFFGGLFLLTTLLSDFDREFDTQMRYYGKIADEVYTSGKLSWKDKLLVAFVDVHRHSATKFLFCISYPLLVGIAINQLFWALLFIGAMFWVRMVGAGVIMFLVLRARESELRVVSVLRRRLRSKS